MIEKIFLKSKSHEKCFSWLTHFETILKLRDKIIKNITFREHITKFVRDIPLYYLKIIAVYTYIF